MILDFHLQAEAADYKIANTWTRHKKQGYSECTFLSNSDRSTLIFVQSSKVVKWLPDNVKSGNNLKNVECFKIAWKTYLFQQFLNDSIVFK
jgi:hypothetical protein